MLTQHGMCINVQLSKTQHKRIRRCKRRGNASIGKLIELAQRAQLNKQDQNTYDKPLNCGFVGSSNHGAKDYED